MKKTTKAQIPSVSKGREDGSRTDEEDKDYVPSESALGLDSAAETERSGETDKMSEEHDAPGGDDIEGEGTGGDTEEEEEEEVDELEESEDEESGGGNKSSTLAGDASDVPKSSATKQGLTLVGKERVSELVHESIATWYHSP